MRFLIKKFISWLGYKITKERPEYKQLLDIYLGNQDHTMIPKKLHISNLEVALKYIKDIPGNVVECGVWRGGMIAGIAEVLKKDQNRCYYLFDSFEGLPEAKEIDGKAAIDWQNDKNGEYYFDNCSAEESFAHKAMKKTGVKYELVKGWFNDTLIENNVKNIALLRMDADWYESTSTILENLYPKVVPNGVIIIDDYYTWDGCSRAVHDYLSKIASTSRLTQLNGVCFIVKTEENQAL